MAQQVDVEAVINQLGAQMGSQVAQLNAELAMRTVQLQQAQARIAELEADTAESAEKPASKPKAA